MDKRSPICLYTYVSCMMLHHRRDLKSLRDLTMEHVPLLKNVKQKACQASVVWVVSHNQAVLDTALYQYYVSTFMHCKGMHPGHDYQSQAS